MGPCQCGIIQPSCLFLHFKPFLVASLQLDISPLLFLNPDVRNSQHAISNGTKRDSVKSRGLMDHSVNNHNAEEAGQEKTKPLGPQVCFKIKIFILEEQIFIYVYLSIYSSIYYLLKFDENSQFFCSATKTCNEKLSQQHTIK